MKAWTPLTGQIFFLVEACSELLQSNVAQKKRWLCHDKLLVAKMLILFLGGLVSFPLICTSIPAKRQRQREQQQQQQQQQQYIFIHFHV